MKLGIPREYGEKKMGTTSRMTVPLLNLGHGISLIRMTLTEQQIWQDDEFCYIGTMHKDIPIYPTVAKMAGERVACCAAALHYL